MKILFALALYILCCQAFLSNDCPSGATLVSIDGAKTVCKFNSAACPGGWLLAGSPHVVGHPHGVHCSKQTPVKSEAKPFVAQDAVFRQVSCDDVVGRFDVLAAINKPNVKSNMESILRFACQQSNSKGESSLDCDAHAKLSNVMNAFVDNLKTCSGLAITKDEASLSVEAKTQKSDERSLVEVPESIEAHSVDTQFSLQSGCNEPDYGCQNTMSCLRSCGGAISSCASAIWWGGLNLVADFNCVSAALGCFKGMDNCCGCAAYWNVISCSSCGSSPPPPPGPPPPPPPPPPNTPCQYQRQCNNDGQYLSSDCSFCTTCPPGTASNGVKNNYLGCPQCTSGKFSTGGATYCSDCPSGKSSGNMASSCTSNSPPPPPSPCFDRFNCGSSNAYLDQMCQSCFNCAPGTASYGKTNSYLSCEPCPVNTYASGYASGTCAACPAGMNTASRRGATECSSGTPPPPPPPALTPSRTWIGGRQTWECMAYEIYPAPSSGPATCKVQCTGNQKITVAVAWWGNSWTGTFPAVSVSQSCGTQVTAKVASLCNGKRGSCSVGAANTNFGDPCVNKGKVLFVDYYCN